MARSGTKYTRVSGAHVAYQTAGSGDPLLLMLGLSTHLDAMWEEPALADFLTRFASFSTLVMFDRRGAGLSDALGDAATLEAHVDDALAVMDAVNAENVTVIAANEASLVALPLVATHPGRVGRLVIVNGTPRFMRADDFPIGVDWSSGRRYAQQLAETYGEERGGIALSAPSRVDDTAFVAWALRYQRLASSPGSFERAARLVGATDVRALLPIIKCPTLVFHTRDDRLLPADHGRYLADHINGATMVELAGADHLPWTGADTERMLREIEAFVTGSNTTSAPDRVLATIVFTDIVSSTERLASVGDREWARLVEAHNAAIDSTVRRFGGRVVDTAGDGVFAVFDGPSRGIEAAESIRSRIAELGLMVRVGVHAGEVEVVGDAVRGVAVHTAARVMGHAALGGVIVSRTVRDLVAGSRFRFESLGPQVLKGLPDPMERFAIVES